MGHFLQGIDMKTYRETAKVTKPRNVKNNSLLNTILTLLVALFTKNLTFDLNRK